MALSIHFRPKSMNAAKYKEVLDRLDRAGAGSPAGRLHHISFGSGDDLEVIDVWDSQASFEKFGATLGPILAELGVDPGDPVIKPVHNIIAG